MKPPRGEGPASPIPLWIGGFSEPAFRRGGTLGDGFTFGGSIGHAISGLQSVRRHLDAAGRPAEGFGAEMLIGCGDLGSLVDSAARWREAGGTHIGIVTMGLGLDTAAAHIDQMERARAALLDEFA